MSEAHQIWFHIGTEKTKAPSKSTTWGFFHVRIGPGNWPLVAQTEETAGARLPRFVCDAFDAFLECGILAHGFLRLRCDWNRIHNQALCGPVWPAVSRLPALGTCAPVPSAQAFRSAH